MFDSIIDEAEKKFRLDGEADTLLYSLLDIINGGGFDAFIERFRAAGLGRLADSWVRTGDNEKLPFEKVTLVLGEETVDRIAKKSSLDKSTAAKALGFMVPRAVDELTPAGRLPADAALSAKVDDFMNDFRVREEAIDKKATRAIGKIVAAALNNVPDDSDEETNHGKVLKWVIPVFLFILIVVVGYRFCGKIRPGTNPNAPNTNARR